GKNLHALVEPIEPDVRHPQLVALHRAHRKPGVSTSLEPREHALTEILERCGESTPCIGAVLVNRTYGLGQTIRGTKCRVKAQVHGRPTRLAATGRASPAAPG